MTSTRTTTLDAGDVPASARLRDGFRGRRRAWCATCSTMSAGTALPLFALVADHRRRACTGCTDGAGADGVPGAIEPRVGRRSSGSGTGRPVRLPEWQYRLSGRHAGPLRLGRPRPAPVVAGSRTIRETRARVLR